MRRSRSAADFTSLARAIEEFMVRLASTSQPDANQTSRLHLIRSALSTIRHLEESARFFAARDASTDIATDKRVPMENQLIEWLQKASDAMDQSDAASARQLHEDVKTHGPTVEALRGSFLRKDPAPMDATAPFEDFLFTAQALRRLAKLIAASAPEPIPPTATTTSELFKRFPRWIIYPMNEP